MTTVVNGRVVGLDLRSTGRSAPFDSVNVLAPDLNPIPPAAPIKLADALTTLRAHRATVEIVHLGDDAPAELVAELSRLGKASPTVTVTSSCPNTAWSAPAPGCWEKTLPVLGQLQKIGDRIGALEIVGYGKPPAALLRLVASLPALRFLWLNVDALDIDGARHLATLKKLRSLILRGGIRHRHIENPVGRFKSSSEAPMELAPGSLATIGALRSLRSLDLGTKDVTQKELRHLTLLTDLAELHLDFCRGIDDRTLQELAPLHSLHHLNLDNTRVKGPGLAHLEGLRRLRSLSLNDPWLSQSAFDYLGRLTRLAWLSLRHNPAYPPADPADRRPLPRHALLPLERLSELRFLDLSGNRP